jgi:hypothetical protein
MCDTAFPGMSKTTLTNDGGLNNLDTRGDGGRIGEVVLHVGGNAVAPLQRRRVCSATCRIYFLLWVGFIYILFIGIKYAA